MTKEETSSLIRDRFLRLRVGLARDIFKGSDVGDAVDKLLEETESDLVMAVLTTPAACDSPGEDVVDSWSSVRAHVHEVCESINGKLEALRKASSPVVESELGSTKIFSGDRSKPLWDDINAVSYSKTTGKAIYVLACRCQELEDKFDAAIAKEHPVAPARPEKPPMLLAKGRHGEDWTWLMWGSGWWFVIGGDGAWRASHMVEVDESASDPAALALWRRQTQEGGA